MHTLTTGLITFLPLRVAEIQADAKQNHTNSDYGKLLEWLTVLYEGESAGLCEVFWSSENPGSPSRDMPVFSKQVCFNIR